MVRVRRILAGITGLLLMSAALPVGAPQAAAAPEIIAAQAGPAPTPAPAPSR
jgi:hypothetical protein